MTERTSRLPRWLGRRTSTAAAPAAVPDPATHAGSAPYTVLEEDGERYLLRSSADRRTSVAELARALPAEPGRPVVVVDVAAEAAGNLGEELGSLIARLSSDTACLAARLVMSGAAAPAAGRTPLAQRLSDAWDLELEAPDAAAVLVPGGGLYVTEPATRAGGWWRFAPGTEPEALGARIPAPRWQRALARVPLGEVGGCTVQQIPAGLLLRPAGTPAPRPGELAFALSVHPERLTVLVSSAGMEQEALAEDLATLLAGLPAEQRRSVRLAPGDGHDLLPVAAAVADLLGTEVEVCTGLPLALPGAAPGSPGEGGVSHSEVVRLNSPGGECTWPALLTAVVCAPAELDGHRPAPRPAHWRLPESVGSPAPEPGTLLMPEGAYVVAVRAGLWVGGSAVPPDEVRERPAEARAARIEVEETGQDDRARGRLLKSLAALLPELDGQVREYAELTAPAGASPETLGALRRFAVRNELTFAAGTRATGAHSPAETAGSAEAEPTLTLPPAPAPAPAPAPGTTAETGASKAPGMSEAPEAPTLPGMPGGSLGAPVRPGALASMSSTGAPERTASSAHAEATVPAVKAATAATGGTESSALPLAPSASSTTPQATPPATPPPTSAPAPATQTPAARKAPASSASGARPAASRRTVATPGTAGATGFSSDGDRAAFRKLASTVWEEHTGPVNQALIRLPALRGPGEAAARADLIAVHLYLASPPDGRFGALALAAESAGASETGPGGGELAAYAACLASGLRRLPALRGTLMRAVPGPEIAEDVLPGAFLYCDAPLDVVHLEQKGAPLPTDEHVRYVIRPMTARRTSTLAGPGGNSATALFAAGSEFCVLARHEADGELPARVLLAEVPPGTAEFRAPSDDAVARLDAAACRNGAAPRTPWPARCTGPFPSLPINPASSTHG
ncbi:hypothetical protein [Streptomyces sp. NPDC054863]